VRNLLDWVPQVGPFINLFMTISSVLIGRYQAYCSDFQVLSAFEDESGEASQPEQTENQQEQESKVSSYLFFMTYRLRCLYDCFISKRKRKNQRKRQRKIEQIETMIYEQFDMARMIKKLVYLVKNQHRILDRLKMLPSREKLVDILLKEFKSLHHLKSQELGSNSSISEDDT